MLRCRMHVSLLLAMGLCLVLVCISVSACLPSEESNDEPAADLTVYSLHDNREIKQAIKTFEQDNEGIHVVCEVGIPTGSDISTDDAVRALNAQIQSEDCPDIIIVDDLPVEAFIERGLLVDLESSEERLYGGSLFFENIINGVNKEGLYIIPTRFTIPIVMGSAKYLNGETTLSSLASGFEDGSIPKVALCPTALIADAYAASFPMIFNDGMMDTEALELFFKDLKVLLHTAEGNFPEEFVANSSFSYLDDAPYCFTSPNLTSSTGELFASSKRAIQISTLADTTDFGYVFLTEQETAGPFVFEALTLTGDIAYAPNTMLSVCSGSDAQDLAERFVAHCLSIGVQQQSQFVESAYQTHSYGGGLPVNKDAFIKAFADNKANDGGYGVGFAEDDTSQPIWYKIDPLNDDQIRQAISLVENADRGAVFDQIITEAIVDGFVSYYEDHDTLDNAVRAVAQSLELYLQQ